jgi:Zn-dependent peptidase ImmA (M78 family)/transcriptional regulator with XRE-family HTH domain
MSNIIPSRITEARESRALSMQDLADNIGVTRQSISKYERGIINPSPDILQSISFYLEFPIDFFYKNEAVCTAKRSPLFFRSKAGIAKKDKTACKYQIKWVDELRKFLSNYVDFIEKDITTIDVNYEDLSKSDIEDLALTVRKNWGLGDGPIGDLVGVLENKGIIVAQFSNNNFCKFKNIDAFSAWEDGIPYIMYNSIQKSAVRTRFSILHELGHLIMHSSISNEDSIKKDVIDLADNQADLFASSFLLPCTSFPNDIHGSSLLSLEFVKRKWGVAISTIIRRCHALNILSENQINYLNRQMTAKQYWRKEPLDDILFIDGPEMLRDAVLLLINNNIITRNYFINSSALSINDLKSICMLPAEFFNDLYDRQKPILKLIP